MATSLQFLKLLHSRLPPWSSPLEQQSGLLGEQREQSAGARGGVQDPQEGCSFYLAVSRNRQQEKSVVQGPPAHSAPPCLLAASQLSSRIWLVPSAGFRIWSQSARGAASCEIFRITCGGAEPGVPSARRLRSLRPFPPARYPARDSAGHRRARPAAARARLGGRRGQETRPRCSPARPSTCASVWRAVRPPGLPVRDR